MGKGVNQGTLQCCMHHWHSCASLLTSDMLPALPAAPVRNSLDLWMPARCSALLYVLARYVTLRLCSLLRGLGFHVVGAADMMGRSL